MLPVLAELSLPALAAVVAGLMLVDGTPLVGLLIPGDLVVVSASTVEGWPAVLVAVAAWTAALVSGHAAGYLAGRHYGAHLWASRIGRRIGFERWCRAERTLRNGGDRTLVATPFIPVVNTVLPLLAGALGVRPSRYLLLIVIADTAWIGVWARVARVPAAGRAARRGRRRAAHLGLGERRGATGQHAGAPSLAPPRASGRCGVADAL